MTLLPTPSLAALVLPSGGEWIAPLLSYLLGSVPFGWLLIRLIKGVDLRTLGSGNIGATNAGRVGGRPLAVLTFLLDFAKGWVPVALIGPAFAAAPERASSLAVLCGAGAVCGHVWPLYLRFRGGKAAATGLGAITGADPLIFIGGGVVWVVSLVATRYVSLASMLMALSFPVFAWLRMDAVGYGWEVVIGALGLALLILLRHRPNITRLLAHTEPRIGARGATEEGRTHA